MGNRCFFRVALRVRGTPDGGTRSPGSPRPGHVQQPRVARQGDAVEEKDLGSPGDGGAQVMCPVNWTSLIVDLSRH